MRPIRPAPNTATLIGELGAAGVAALVIVSSNVLRFFNGQFQLVRKRDEERLTQADGAGQRAERERAPLLHKELRGRVAGERRETAVGDDERFRLMMVRDAQAIWRFLAVRLEADRNHDVA